MDDGTDEADERELIALGRAVKEEPRTRHFPYLGYSIVLYPIDLIESRLVARMMFGTMYGFKPDEVIELQARRIAVDDEPERTWWVFAVPDSAKERRLAEHEVHLAIEEAERLTSGGT